MTEKRTITVAHGDGIGPEIMEASLRILVAAGANLELEEVNIGEKVFLSGNTSGISPSAWESIQKNKILFKAPFTTPQGGGHKSINVTLRKSLGLFANVRPVAAYTPYVESHHPNLNLIIIRENEEDLYAGIEHRQTYEVYQSLKLMTLPGSERIIRYAFEYAKSHGRKKITCMTKDNIMKQTDGMFHKMFDHVAREYPDMDTNHLIIDIGTARMAARPEDFDVVVVPNLYGDVLSDVAALLTGSVGLAGSANIGDNYAMFEAVHGSAPDIAGQGIANPSGLILAGALMLMYIGQAEIAVKVQNAWRKTLEDGIHTGDIFTEGSSVTRVGTDEFASAVIKRLGQKPTKLRALDASKMRGELPRAIKVVKEGHQEKELVGVDVFIDWDEDNRDPNKLAVKLQTCDDQGIALTMITNRGLSCWPTLPTDAFYTDHWRCRFLAPDNSPITHQQVVSLLDRMCKAGFDFIKTEGLYTFDGEPGFSLGQGQ